RVVDAKAPRLVIGKRVWPVEAAGVHPYPAPALSPGLLHAGAEQVAPQSLADEARKQPKVRHLDVVIRLHLQLDVAGRRPRHIQDQRLDRGSIQVSQPARVVPMQAIDPVPGAANRGVKKSAQLGRGDIRALDARLGARAVRLPQLSRVEHLEVPGGQCDAHARVIFSKFGPKGQSRTIKTPVLTFAVLAQCFEQLEQTSSRKQLTTLLAELLGQVDADEIAEVSYLLQGRVAPLYEPVEFGLGERSIEKAVAQAFDVSAAEVHQRDARAGDAGLVVAELATEAGRTGEDRTIREVFADLRALADLSGSGSADAKVSGLTRLLAG